MKTIQELVQNLSVSPPCYIRDVATLRDSMELMGTRAGFPSGLSVERSMLGTRQAEMLISNSAGPHLLYLHGGGYVAGSCASHRHLGGLLAAEMGGVVHMLDYRLAPEAPCPAPVEDAAIAYRELMLEFPDRAIAIAGDSAGGGLALVTAQRVRNRGERLPSCVALFSPWVDQTMQDPSFDAPIEQDPTLSKASLEWYASCYRPHLTADDPLVSPTFADLRNLPPILIQAGGREVLAGDARQLHAKMLAAGSNSSLSIWPDMIHAWHLFWPWLAEGRSAVAEAAKFIRTHTVED